MIDITHTPSGHLLTALQWLPRPVDEVFPFFAEAENLEAITPPWLGFRIVSETPVSMREGTLIDYRLRLHGLPLRWRTRITTWEPPHRFVDEQLRGPYREWNHEHTFEPHRGGTLVRDQVSHRVFGGNWVHRLFVRGDLIEIFEYRRKRLSEHFGSSSVANRSLRQLSPVDLGAAKAPLSREDDNLGEMLE